MITGKIASGAAPAVAGIAGAALLAGKAVADPIRGVMNGLSKSHDREQAVANGGGAREFLAGDAGGGAAAAAAAGGDAGGGVRPHKVPFMGGSGRQESAGLLGGLVGAAVGAALAPVAFAGGLARRAAGRDPAHGAHGSEGGDRFAGRNRGGERPKNRSEGGAVQAGAAQVEGGQAGDELATGRLRPQGVARAEGPSAVPADNEQAALAAPAAMVDRLPPGVSMHQDGQQAVFKRGRDVLATAPWREAQAQPAQALGQALASAHARGRDDIPADIKAHYGLGAPGAAAGAKTPPPMPAKLAASPGAATGPARAVEPAAPPAAPLAFPKAPDDVFARPAAAPAPAPTAEGPLDAPTDMNTVRQYPLDAVTPIALRDFKVSPNVIRRRDGSAGEEA
jgi:hypothetical protein